VKNVVNDLETKAEEILLTSLRKVPFLSVESIQHQAKQGNFAVNFMAEVKTPSQGRIKLIIEVKNNGEPRLARDASNQLQVYLNRSISSGPIYGVFMAPYISEQASEILKANHLGYMDFSGNCLLHFGEVFIEKTGQPNLFSHTKNLKTLYSKKAERVLRVLLNHKPREWKTLELAQEAKVSLGEVSKVRRVLADRELIDNQLRGIKLQDPKVLLEAWAGNYTYRRNPVNSFYYVGEVADFETKLAAACAERGIRYGLTGFSGAVRWAPAVRYRNAMALVDVIDEALLQALKIQPADSGPNVLLLTPYDEGVFFASKEFEGIKVVSPVQLYLDVAGDQGRGEEAAEALKAKLIEEIWISP
jgi:hypothetical protein